MLHNLEMERLLHCANRIETDPLTALEAPEKWSGANHLRNILFASKAIFETNIVTCKYGERTGVTLLSGITKGGEAF